MQIDYLMRSLERLAESLITIQPNQKLRPSTVNITFSKEISKRKEIVVKSMMGASIHYKIPIKNLSSCTRALRREINLGCILLRLVTACPGLIHDDYDEEYY
jgi:hypothetical protein